MLVKPYLQCALIIAVALLQACALSPVSAPASTPSASPDHQNDASKAAPFADEAYHQLYRLTHSSANKITDPFDEASLQQHFEQDWQQYQLGQLDCTSTPGRYYYFKARFAERRPISPKPAPTPASTPSSTNTSQNGCAGQVAFFIQGQLDQSQVRVIDLSRIRDVHLMFAGEGSGLASRFGHLALRLVVCPSASSSDQACAENLREHIMLGFMANVDDFKIDTWKGIKGDYDSYLYANTFMHAYENYTINEFRELYSVPLPLSDTGRESMLRKLAEIHWRYRGPYKFFTNNCATLLQNALALSWPAYQNHTLSQRNFMRPDSFFEALLEQGLLNNNLITDKNLAEQQGYYFASTLGYYQAALDYLKAALTTPFFEDLDSYLEFSPEQRKAHYLADSAFNTRLQHDDRLREALIVVEGYGLLNAERLIGTYLLKLLAEVDFIEQPARVYQSISPTQGALFKRCIVDPLAQQLTPPQGLASMPTPEQLNTLAPKTLACSDKETYQALNVSLAELASLNARHNGKAIADANGAYTGFKQASSYWQQAYTYLAQLVAMRPPPTSQ